MSSGHIRVNTIDPFNKLVVFEFNMQICLTCLAYKGISFCYYYCLIFCCNYMFVTIFVVVIVFLILDM